MSARPGADVERAAGGAGSTPRGSAGRAGRGRPGVPRARDTRNYAETPKGNYLSVETLPQGQNLAQTRVTVSACELCVCVTSVIASSLRSPIGLRCGPVRTHKRQTRIDRLRAPRGAGGARPPPGSRGPGRWPRCRSPGDNRAGTPRRRFLAWSCWRCAPRPRGLTRDPSPPAARPQRPAAARPPPRGLSGNERDEVIMMHDHLRRCSD